MRLHYEVQGDGAPLVMTTGIGDSSEVWAEYAERLSPRFRVVTWDHRGHGRSEKSDSADDYSPDLAVGDLRRMIGLAGGGPGRPAVLVGHSLGGYLSLALAVRQPELVKALILIATGPGFRDVVAREQWNTRSLGIDFGSALAPQACRLGMQTDSLVIDNLGRIEAPALIVAGSADRSFFAAKDYLAARLGKASVVSIEGGRHSLHRTHRPEILSAIEGFVRARGLAPA